MILGLCAGLLGCAGAARTDIARPTDSGIRAGVSAFDIHFVIDKDFDRTHIYGMLHHDDPAGLASRAASMGITRDVAERIHAAKDVAEVADVIAKLVDERYGRLAASLGSARQEYTALWQPIVEKFSKTVTSMTGHTWFHPGYVCVVSVFHPGISDWYGSKIAARYDLSPKLKLRIVAHEIVLSHVFQLARASYGRQQLDDQRLWAFSEISAAFILGEPSLASLWPEQARPGEYFSHSNYPQLASLEAELLPLFSGRRDFGNYIDRSVPVLLRFQQTRP